MDDDKPVRRRQFMLNLLGVGGVLLASLGWYVANKDHLESGNDTRPPKENDREHIAGTTAPRTKNARETDYPHVSGTPAPAPTKRPLESDHQPPPGTPPPPPPSPKGKGSPRPSPSPPVERPPGRTGGVVPSRPLNTQ